MKTIVGLLTAVLLLFVATACGSAGDSSSSEPETAVPQDPALVVFYTDN